MILGTRSSSLAMAQTNIVVSLLDGEDIEIKKINTSGDKITDKPLRSFGLGAFVRELDAMIVSGEIDFAVNSLKDMPSEDAEGTILAAVLPRGPIEDVLLSEFPLEKLPQGAVVGTSSVRRAAILHNIRPDIEIKDLRGNVHTRLEKWKSGDYDAIILARAGLERLNLQENYHILDPNVFVPAAGQGAIAVVCAENSPYLPILSKLNDDNTRKDVDVERKILSELGSGCSIPVGIHATNGGSKVTAVAVSDDKIVKVNQKINDDSDIKSIAAELRRGICGE